MENSGCYTCPNCKIVYTNYPIASTQLCTHCGATFAILVTQPAPIFHTAILNVPQYINVSEWESFNINDGFLIMYLNFSKKGYDTFEIETNEALYFLKITKRLICPLQSLNLKNSKVTPEAQELCISRFSDTCLHTMVEYFEYELLSIKPIE